MRVGLSLSASVHYDVLRHLELGADAASLHDGAKAPWSAALTAAYPTGEGSDLVQVLPLITPNLGALLTVLREGGPFERRLGAVIADHAPAFGVSWQAARADHARRADALADALDGPLRSARAALWSRAGRAAPELLVLDARPLGRHARGAAIGGRQVVAASFAHDDADLFCAILHEETHSVSDPEVLGGRRPARDTRRAAPGYAVHRALERAALDVADEVIRHAVPELAQHHARWVERRRAGLG